MNHFIVFINYIVPFEQIQEILPKHRAYLDKGYQSGMLLMSGPNTAKTGGIVVARANSLNELKDFFTQDPYNINNAATYSYHEFDPVKYNDIVKSWISL